MKKGQTMTSGDMNFQVWRNQKRHPSFEFLKFCYNDLLVKSRSEFQNFWKATWVVLYRFTSNHQMYRLDQVSKMHFSLFRLLFSRCYTNDFTTYDRRFFFFCLNLEYSQTWRIVRSLPKQKSCKWPFVCGTNHSPFWPFFELH